eukprot:11216605-Lingulodinium_polyedra.AAC.1
MQKPRMRRCSVQKPEAQNSRDAEHHLQNNIMTLNIAEMQNAEMQNTTRIAFNATGRHAETPKMRGCRTPTH